MRAAWLLALVLAGGCDATKKTPDALAGLETRTGETKFTLDRLNTQRFALGPAVVLDTTQGDEWVLSGWAVDLPAGKPARGVVLILDGKRQLPAKYGILRNDIAVVLGDLAYARTGFEARVDWHELSKGRHTVEVAILSADGRGVYRPTAEWSFAVR